MATSNSKPSILWFQLIGLSLIQGAISLTWLLYRLYVPQLYFDQLITDCQLEFSC